MRRAPFAYQANWNGAAASDHYHRKTWPVSVSHSYELPAQGNSAICRSSTCSARERTQRDSSLSASWLGSPFLSELQKAHANPEPPRLGRLRRYLVHPGIRSHLQMQSGCRLHGLERRAGGQTSRRSSLELRRHLALERRRHDAGPLRAGGSAGSVEDSELLPGFTHAHRLPLVKNDGRSMECR